MENWLKEMAFYSVEEFIACELGLFQCMFLLDFVSITLVFIITIAIL